MAILTLVFLENVTSLGPKGQPWSWFFIARHGHAMQPNAAEKLCLDSCLDAILEGAFDRLFVFPAPKFLESVIFE